MDCSVAECIRIAKKRGLCETHYQRWRVHGDLELVGEHAESLRRDQRRKEAASPEAITRVLAENHDGHPLEIELTDGSIALVDAGDYFWLMQWNWQPHCDGYAYYMERQDGKYARCVLMHREIMQTPDGMDTDHINRNPLDNRRINLRVTDRTQNNFNSGLHVNNTSGHRGVSWSKRHNLWRAYIGGTKNRVELGWFKSLEDAIDARLAAEAQFIQ